MCPPPAPSHKFLLNCAYVCRTSVWVQNTVGALNDLLDDEIADVNDLLDDEIAYVNDLLDDEGQLGALTSASDRDVIVVEDER